MPITNQEAWNGWVENNQDYYGGTCVSVARRVMEILDQEEKFEPYDVICRADDDIKAGGITGFMAGCVASMISQCHSQGEEFRRIWNGEIQIGNEGEEATKNKRTLNPALMTMQVKK